MELAKIIDVIEKTAPLSIAADWDHSGIQVAAERTQIHHLAVCLDPTPASISRALQHGADMVLSHHPLSLSPRFPDRLDTYHAVLRLLLRADVPLYASHTSLDANPDGPSGWLAQKLGLTASRVLEVTGVRKNAGGQECEAGFGIAGHLPAPLAIADILAVAGVEHARLVGAAPTHRVERVAICPGSGSSLAALAASAGAQLLVTGDLKYHDALDAPLPILDVGHFSLEERMMRLFSQALRETLPEINVSFVPSSDPFIVCQPFSTSVSEDQYEPLS